MVIRVKNTFKVIGIILLVVIAILAVIKIRDYILINKLSNELAELCNYPNIHIKTEYLDNNGTDMESFRKDNKKNAISVIESNNDFTRVISQWIDIDKDEEIMYYEADNKKIAIISAVNMGRLEFFVPTIALDYQNINSSFLSKLVNLFYIKPIMIKTIDGQKCYELSDIQGNTKIYINKETYEPVQSDNGGVTKYKFEKDVVSDKDVERPDLTDFVVTMQ